MPFNNTYNFGRLLNSLTGEVADAFVFNPVQSLNATENYFNQKGNKYRADFDRYLKNQEKVADLIAEGNELMSTIDIHDRLQPEAEALLSEFAKYRQEPYDSMDLASPNFDGGARMAREIGDLKFKLDRLKGKTLHYERAKDFYRENPELFTPEVEAELNTYLEDKTNTAELPSLIAPPPVDFELINNDANKRVKRFASDTGDFGSTLDGAIRTETFDYGEDPEQSPTFKKFVREFRLDDLNQNESAYKANFRSVQSRNPAAPYVVYSFDGQGNIVGTVKELKDVTAEEYYITSTVLPRLTSDVSITVDQDASDVDKERARVLQNERKEELDRLRIAKERENLREKQNTGSGVQNISPEVQKELIRADLNDWIRINQNAAANDVQILENYDANEQRGVIPGGSAVVQVPTDQYLPGFNEIKGFKNKGYYPSGVFYDFETDEFVLQYDLPSSVNEDERQQGVRVPKDSFMRKYLNEVSINKNQDIRTSKETINWVD